MREKLADREVHQLSFGNATSTYKNYNHNRLEELSAIVPLERREDSVNNWKTPGMNLSWWSRDPSSWWPRTHENKPCPLEI